MALVAIVSITLGFVIKSLPSNSNLPEKLILFLTIKLPSSSTRILCVSSLPRTSNTDLSSELLYDTTADISFEESVSCLNSILFFVPVISLVTSVLPIISFFTFIVFPTLKSSVILAEPVTCNFLSGIVFPIPILPDESIVKLLALLILLLTFE